MYGINMHQEELDYSVVLVNCFYLAIISFTWPIIVKCVFYISQIDTRKQAHSKWAGTLTKLPIYEKSLWAWENQSPIIKKAHKCRKINYVLNSTLK